MKPCQHGSLSYMYKWLINYHFIEFSWLSFTHFYCTRLLQCFLCQNREITIHTRCPFYLFPLFFLSLCVSVCVGVWGIFKGRWDTQALSFLKENVLCLSNRQQLNVRVDESQFKRKTTTENLRKPKYRRGNRKKKYHCLQCRSRCVFRKNICAS